MKVINTEALVVELMRKKLLVVLCLFSVFLLVGCESSKEDRANILNALKNE